METSIMSKWTVLLMILTIRVLTSHLSYSGSFIYPIYPGMLSLSLIFILLFPFMSFYHAAKYTIYIYIPSRFH